MVFLGGFAVSDIHSEKARSCRNSSALIMTADSFLDARNHSARVLIYTAIYGAYDDLKQPVEQDYPCDFLCFTDTPAPEQIGAWHIIQSEGDPNFHPRMQAKLFKILSHQVFPGGRLAPRHDPARLLTRFTGPYDFTIWMDASLAIKSSTFVREMMSTTGDSGWAMFAHPDRDCIFQEANLSSQLKKYLNLPVHEQVSFYGEAGIQPHSGLFACGVIVRREPLDSSLMDANLSWWRENCRWTYQDQLSLPYVLKLHNLRVDTIPGNQWDNSWFDLVPHKSML